VERTSGSGAREESPALRPVDRSWIVGLPKAEVHVHLEGCISPDLLARAARRGGAELPATGPFDGLGAMLRSLDASCALLTEPADIVELALAYGRSTVANGVAYSDLIVNPAHWPAWTARLGDFVRLLDEGCGEAEAEGAGRIGLCPSIGRWMAAGEAGELVDTLIELRHPRVVGVSLDGDEGAPGAGSDRFAPALERARRNGLGVAVHAGESSGPDGVRHALDVLRADRIDHGIRSIDDPVLVADLADRGTPLGICPSSNVQLHLVPTLSQHPVEQLRRLGVRVSLNTDDPVLFGTTLVDEYLRTAAAFGWDRTAVAELARTSITASFASSDRKIELLAALDRYTRADQP
jgi:adenosine deaminase